jgi:hypothetical protein
MVDGKRLPCNIDAAFSWPSKNSGTEYYVYYVYSTTEPTGSRETTSKANIMFRNSLTLFMAIICFKIFALKNWDFYSFIYELLKNLFYYLFKKLFPFSDYLSNLFQFIWIFIKKKTFISLCDQLVILKVCETS